MLIQEIESEKIKYQIYKLQIIKDKKKFQNKIENNQKCIQRLILKEKNINQNLKKENEELNHFHSLLEIQKKKKFLRSICYY